MNQPTLEHQPLKAIEEAFGGADELLILLAYRNQHRDDIDLLLDSPYPSGFAAKHTKHLNLLESNLPEFDDAVTELIEANQLVINIFKTIAAERKSGRVNSERATKLATFQRSQYILLALHIEANGLLPTTPETPQD